MRPVWLIGYCRYLNLYILRMLYIHGQNDNQSILDISSHLELLDSYSSNNISNLLEEYSTHYSEYVNIKLELSKNYGDDKEKMRKLDLLRYQVNEIFEAKLKENEEEQIFSDKRIL